VAAVSSQRHVLLGLGPGGAEADDCDGEDEDPD
jgi:hypothetical protein